MMNNNRIPAQYDFSELLKKDDLGSVSAVVEKKSGKLFIFKEISPSAKPDFVRRFLREAEVLAELSHPGIVKVQAFGDVSNPYIILEYFKGKNLAELIRAGSLSPEDKKTVFASILSGIAYAHSADVIHRDIKPENILIGTGNSVKIIDFGLALREYESGKTAKGGIIGTPSYISPEILNGEPASKSTDLFSLGVTGVELFTGVNPFAGTDINDTINRLLSYEGLLPADLNKLLPAEFRDVISALISPEPEKREIPADFINSGGFTIKKRKPAYFINHLSSSKIKRYVAAFFIVSIFVSAVIAGSGKVFNEGTEVSVNNIPDSKISGNSLLLSQSDEPVINGNTEIKKVKDEYAGKVSEINPVTEENEPETGFGFYTVNVMPWAKVYIDGSYAETTPLKGPLKIQAGNRSLRLYHPDYGEYATTINVKPGSTGEFTHNFRSISGYLMVQVFPWAEVYINEKKAGLTPLTSAIPLPAGEYKIKLINPAYTGFEKTIKITNSDTLRIHHSFK